MSLVGTGFSQVCTTDACWDPLPQNATYNYAETFGNTTRIWPWSNNKLQYLFAHETGHTLSLGHGSDPWELMYDSCCVAFDTYGTYQPTASEINAINARY